MNARIRAAATALAVVAAVTLTVSGPVTAEAKIKGVDGGAVTAMYKPGPPPVWCGSVRLCS